MHFKRFTIIFFSLILIFFVCGYYIFLSTYSIDYVDLIEYQLEKYDNDKLSKELILSVIHAESNFDRNAKSRAGAIGLMQILPTTGEWVVSEMKKENRALLNENLYDPYTNIIIGIWYLNYLSNKFDKIEYAIASYNAGENVVSKWQKKNIQPHNFPYAETKKYVKNVQSNVIIYNKKSNLLKIVEYF